MVCTCTATPALAAPFGHHHGGGHGLGGSPGQDFSDPQGDLPFPVPGPLIQPALPTGTAQTMQIQLTGYAAADNTPAGSRTISMPVVHQEAGGTCTHSDPVTFASPGSAGSTEFPRGQIIYFPKLKCFGISEDSGATQESIKHIDIYTGSGSGGVTGPCEDALTGPTTVIVNAPATEPVIAGPLSSGPGSCRVGGASDPTTDTNTGAPSATGARSGTARHTRHADAGDGS